MDTHLPDVAHWLTTQNEPGVVPTATKVDFIERLAACGIKSVEATSFVSAKWVPQVCLPTSACDELDQWCHRSPHTAQRGEADTPLHV